MFPYHFQIDSLYFHVMKGSLLKGKQISSLLLRLQKHKKYDQKVWSKTKQFLQYDGAVRSSPCHFFVYIKMRVEYWFTLIYI